MILLIFRRIHSKGGLENLLAAKSWKTLYPQILTVNQELASFDAGSPLMCEDNFTFSKISPEEEDESLDILADIVPMREPLAVHIKLSRAEFRDVICEKFLLVVEWAFDF